MPSNAICDEVDLMERVLLPMSNLRFALEEILEQGQTIDQGDLIRGSRAVHRNVEAIQSNLNAGFRIASAASSGFRTLAVLCDMDRQGGAYAEETAMVDRLPYNSPNNPPPG